MLLQSLVSAVLSSYVLPNISFPDLYLLRYPRHFCQTGVSPCFLAVTVHLLNHPPRKPENLMEMVARDFIEMMRERVSSEDVSRKEG